jgi:hypothetical protein
MNYDRSLIFTVLLDSPEFAHMQSDRGSRLISDAVARLAQDRAEDPAIHIDASVRGYLADIGTGNLETYVDTLIAGDERR